MNPGGYQGKNFDPNYHKKKFGGFQKDNVQSGKGGFPGGGFKSGGGFEKPGFKKQGGGGFQKQGGGGFQKYGDGNSYTIIITNYPQNIGWTDMLSFLNTNVKFRFLNVKLKNQI
jgi:hypothetical protein